MPRHTHQCEQCAARFYAPQTHVLRVDDETEGGALRDLHFCTPYCRAMWFEEALRSAHKQKQD